MLDDSLKYQGQRERQNQNLKFMVLRFQLFQVTGFKTKNIYIFNEILKINTKFGLKLVSSTEGGLIRL